jgi:hypothetical protein
MQIEEMGLRQIRAYLLKKEVEKITPKKAKVRCSLTYEDFNGIYKMERFELDGDQSVYRKILVEMRRTYDYIQLESH